MIFPIFEDLEQSINTRNYSNFRSRFKTLTKTCNACHSAENVSYFNVKEPKTRITPLFEKQ